jgi:hypothetical protein
MQRSLGHGAQVTALAFLLGAAASTARAQDATTAPVADTDPAYLSVIDEDPIPSPRGAGMADALVTSSDDLDAAFNNPAGIGGLNVNKKTNNWVRKLYFPWASVSVNQNSQELYKEVKQQGGTNDSTIGKAIVDAAAGERQYARANMIAGLVVGRTMIAPFSDVQIAATSEGNGSNLVDMHYSSTSGIGYGFSAQDKDGRISLGYFGYLANRSETTGTFLYDDIISQDQRKEILSANSTKYGAAGHNVGMIWKLGKAGSPTLGVAAKNAGDTKWKASGEGEDVIQKQDLAMGFSVGPQLGRSSWWNTTLQVSHLSEPDVSLIKKYRVGTELMLDGYGSYATFALRGGYSYAGPSAGLSLNLGLIGLEASAYTVDVGAGNERVPERRGIVALYVNVADF